jgi:hypothetical protein
MDESRLFKHTCCGQRCARDAANDNISDARGFGNHGIAFHDDRWRSWRCIGWRCIDDTGSRRRADINDDSC